MKLKRVWLQINGVNRSVLFEPEKDRLIDIVRRMGLTGTKEGCSTGVCGSCTVLLDGLPVRSCTRKMDGVPEYSEIMTIEGIGTPLNPHPLQLSFIANGAVQCGFCSPGFIVSAYALLLQNSAPSREQVREWFTKYRHICRCSGYVQITDAVMEAAQVIRGERGIDDLKRRIPETALLYGSRIPRPSALAKVCGVADYGEDVKLQMPPETLHAAIVQPRVSHRANILAIHTQEAEQMPGVVRVITHRDVQGTNHLGLGPNHGMDGMEGTTSPILCYDKINRYGDVVAIVVANSFRQAKEAAAKVLVEVEPLPEYLNYLDAVKTCADRIHGESENIYLKQPILKGMPERVPHLLQTSAHMVRGSFYSTRQPHLTVEGDTVQAYWDEDDMLTIQCKSHGIMAARANISKAIGLPIDRVRVVLNVVGGSFGWSTNALSYAMAAIAVMTTNMPIALSISYEEFMHMSGKRSPSYINGSLACDDEGIITAAEFDAGLDHGPYPEISNKLITRVARFAFFPYYIPNAVGLVRMAFTNHNFGVSYRGFGSPQIYTMGESLVDMLASKAGIDPFEFRLRNVARLGQDNLNSYPFRQYPMVQMMERMRPHYETAVRDAKSEDTPDVRRGVGIAWGGYTVTAGPTDFCSVAVELNEQGGITKYDTWQDVGQGGDVGSLMVTLAAFEPLGLTPDKVRLVQNDSKYCPDSGMSAASRSHYMNGNATRIAANQLMDAMRKADGGYYTHDEMVARGLPTKFEYKYSNMVIPDLCELDPGTGVGDPVPAYSYMLFMAEVAVEVATGKTKVLRYICVDDVGVIGNILALDGQAYGGIAHGIGFALSENYDDVKKHNNPYSCGVSYATDIPDKILLEHVENYREDGPFGSSGASEGYQSSSHVAVLNAIYNACGVRIYELPATPAKIRQGLDILEAGDSIHPPEKYMLGSDLYEELGING